MSEDEVEGGDSEQVDLPGNAGQSSCHLSCRDGEESSTCSNSYRYLRNKAPEAMELVEIIDLMHSNMSKSGAGQKRLRHRRFMGTS